MADRDEHGHPVHAEDGEHELPVADDAGTPLDLGEDDGVQLRPVPPDGG